MEVYYTVIINLVFMYNLGYLEKIDISNRFQYKITCTIYLNDVYN